VPDGWPAFIPGGETVSFDVALGGAGFLLTVSFSWGSISSSGRSGRPKNWIRGSRRPPSNPRNRGVSVCSSPRGNYFLPVRRPGRRPRGGFPFNPTSSPPGRMLPGTGHFSVRGQRGCPRCPGGGGARRMRMDFAHLGGGGLGGLTGRAAAGFRPMDEPFGGKIQCLKHFFACGGWGAVFSRIDSLLGPPNIFFCAGPIVNRFSPPSPGSFDRLDQRAGPPPQVQLLGDPALAWRGRPVVERDPESGGLAGKSSGEGGRGGAGDSVLFGPDRRGAIHLRGAYRARPGRFGVPASSREAAGPPPWLKDGRGRGIFRNTVTIKGAKFSTGTQFMRRGGKFARKFLGGGEIPS